MDAHGPDGSDSAGSTGSTPDAADTVDSLDPADPPRHSALPWRRGAVTLVAVLSLVAAGALGASLAGGSTVVQDLAASSDPSTDDDAAPDDDDRRPFGRGMLHGHGPGPGPLVGHGLLGSLHGSYVVEDPDGGYRTVLSQRGEATAVSDTSITVLSEDGYQATYRLTDDTTLLGGPSGTESIEKGADVAVTAVKDGGSPRAVHVVDLSQLHERFQRHLDDLPDAPEDEPSEAPSGTATSGANV